MHNAATPYLPQSPRDDPEFSHCLTPETDVLLLPLVGGTLQVDGS